MKKVCKLGDPITAINYGNKAFWLNWLFSQGVPVPDSVFVPVLNRLQINQLKENENFKIQLLDQLHNTLKCRGCMAVRSSSVREDGQGESLAGRYRSFLNVKNVDEAIICMQQMAMDLKEEDKLGVIIQQMICPQASGVIFSSNPWNGTRTESYISFTSGTGDKLLAGIQNGKEIRADIRDDIIHFSNCPEEIELKKMEDLVYLSKKIEQKLNMPVDIEWCIEEESNKLILLQCRPITSILLRENKILSVNLENLRDLPSQLIDHDKVWIRCFAEQNQIMISEASLLICNCQAEQLPPMDYQIRKSQYHCGFSAVLISPSKINGKIQRYFVGKSQNVYSCAKCHRFGVRSLADYEQLENCLNDLYQVARKEQWTCAVVIQEILSAKYTGIIKKMRDGYMIEVAKGHFMSKGLFPMSIYLVNFDGQISYRNEIEQEKYIDIIEGCMLEYYLQPFERITLSDEIILKIVSQFHSILNKKKMLVEFGILNDEQDTPYLIDCVKTSREVDVPFSEIERGVLSEGRITGRLVKIKLDNTMEALDTHFYNSVDTPMDIKGEHILFYSETPSIQLMELLNHYDSSQIGFIFKTGSLLCHFAVLLRERGIPAMRGIDDCAVEEGKSYLLDTKISCCKYVGED